MQNTAVGRRLRRGGAVVLVMAAMAATLGIANPALASPGSRHDDDKVLDGRVRFYVERETNAGRQAEIWAAEGRTRDAAYMRALARISQAVWFTSGTPAEVRRAVHATVDAAQRQHAVPVLVTYYVLGMASRLLRGGIDKAQGFFLNVSNFRSSADLVDYGTRLSKCVAFRQATGASACSDADIASVPEDPDALPHFVLDTSRNGQGPWVPPVGLYPDPQDWCNPPGRGLGVRPTTRTGNELVDAFLWVKRPGESDGQCTRGTAGPEDPVYGAVDPPAGQWWAEYALGLAQRADPPLRLR